MILDGIKYKRKVLPESKNKEAEQVQEFVNNAIQILDNHGISLKHNNYMRARAIEKCKGDVLEEYARIKNKKSKLSLGERNWIARNFESKWEIDNG